MQFFKIERSYWSFSMGLNPQDTWIGVFWKKHLGPRLDFYICIIPCIVIEFVIVYRKIT